MNDNPTLYIPAAKDGSWMAPAPFLNEDDARNALFLHEPDRSKLGAYHIITTTLADLVNKRTPGVNGGLKQRLVKWDGEAPAGGIPDDASLNPHLYPQVAEVLESDRGSVPKVIYRRS